MELILKQQATNGALLHALPDNWYLKNYMRLQLTNIPKS